MKFFRTLSKMTGESERDLKARFQRARSLLIGNESAKDYLDDPNLALTGKIYLITTWRTGKGEEDFSLILRRKYHKITEIIRMNWYRDKERALERAIRRNWHQFRKGDIVAIVRGGGDTSDMQFRPFKDLSAVSAIKALREERMVTVVTGVGHSSDYFPVENAATFRQATPTDAAYKICDLLEVRT